MSLDTDIEDGTLARRVSRRPRVSLFARIMTAKETGVFLALVVMCVFLAFATESFLTSTNLLNVGRQIALLGIMSVGMTFVLISGEIDLSVGATYALGGLGAGMLIVMGWPLGPALLLGLMIGAAVGLINGVLSTYGRLPSLIATLGMMSIIRGSALLLTDGQPVTVNVRNGADPQVLETFKLIGQGYLSASFQCSSCFSQRSHCWAGSSSQGRPSAFGSLPLAAASRQPVSRVYMCRASRSGPSS